MNIKNNDINLMKEFILFFTSLSDHDFQYYREFFVHNRINSEIADIIDIYNRLDKQYDFLATKAFLQALELRVIFN